MAAPIDRVARAVSDGKPVDWVKEKSARPEDLEDLEQLAIVQRIASVHQTFEKAKPPAPEIGLDSTAVAMPERTPGETPALLFTWGRLQVLEKVGEGGGGEVYRAIDPALKAEVALKLLRSDYADSPQLVRRFLDEAQRLARVRHHNVLTVYGADEHDGRVGLWTEFVRGKSLEQYLVEQGPLSACEAAVIGLDLCRALAAVHAGGLVHRDVKTTNVMRADGGRIVLMDFGSVAEAPVGEATPRSVGFHGTPITMPPEQLRGAVAGPATDIYALGVLLYRLVTRRYPVEASSLAELEEKHRKGVHTPVRDRRADLPLEFVRVVETALKVDPAMRYQSTGMMEEALAGTLGSMAQQHRTQRRYLGALAAALVVVAVAAGVIIGRQAWKDKENPPAPIPATPARLTADVSLIRRTGDREAPLTANDRVAPGDYLSMFVRGRDSMFIYVLDKSAVGEVYGLFPIRGLMPSNPLRANMRHRLPGDLGSEVVYWRVTSPGERETIYAIGSRAPIPELDSALASIPTAQPGRPVQFGILDAAALENLRGIGSGTAMPPPPGEAVARFEAAMEALKAQAKDKGDVFVWSLDLRNPAPAP